MSALTLQLNSQNHWLADGIDTVWNFQFSGGYIDPSHVKAYKKSPAGVRTELTVVPSTDLIGPYQLRIFPAVDAGYTLVIYRATPKDLPIVDFTDGGGVTEESLDIVAKQAVFVAAESADFLGVTTSEDLAALALSAGSSAGAASASASTAAAAAAAAVAAAVDAAASAASAADSETTALETINSLASSGGSGIIGWIQAGAGAVFRWVQDKLRESKSLEDFGAVGDNVVDDRAAILLALAYCRSVGAKLKVGAKAYYCSDSITISEGGALYLEGDAGPRNTPVDVERTSTFRFAAGKSGIIIADASGDGIDSINIKNLTIYKGTIDTKGSGTIGLKVMGLKNSEIKNVMVNGFDVNHYLDANNGTDAEPNLVTFTQLRLFQAGTYQARIRACADIYYNRCRFGGDGGTLDSLVQIDDGQYSGVPDAVHFNRCFFVPSPGQTSPFGVRNNSDQSLWITFDTCVFESVDTAGILVNKRVSTYDAGDRVTTFVKNSWFNMEPLAVPIISINGSLSLKDSRLYADGTNTPAVKLDATALAKFNTTMSGNAMFVNNGQVIEAYKQDGAVITANVLGMTGTTPSVKAFLIADSQNFVIDDNRDHTNTLSSVTAPGTVGTWGGYTALSADGPRLKMRRYTGVADGAGVYTVAHGEANGNQRVVGAFATWSAAGVADGAMTLNYVDGTNAQFTGAGSGSSVRALLTFTEDTAGW